MVWKGAYFPFQHGLPQVTSTVPIMLLFQREAFLLLLWLPTRLWDLLFQTPSLFLCSLCHLLPFRGNLLQVQSPCHTMLLQTSHSLRPSQVFYLSKSAAHVTQPPGTPSHLAENSSTQCLVFPSPFLGGAGGGFKKMLTCCSSGDMAGGPRGVLRAGLHREVMLMEMEMQALAPPPPQLSPGCESLRELAEQSYCRGGPFSPLWNVLLQLGLIFITGIADTTHGKEIPAR